MDRNQTDSAEERPSTAQLVVLHVGGAVATVLAAMVAAYLGVVVAWADSYCDQDETREVVGLRITLMLLAAGVAVVPLVIGWWARRCRTTHLPWFLVSLGLAAVGGWSALTSDPYQWCLF